MLKGLLGNTFYLQVDSDKETKKRNNSVSVYSYTEFPILQLAWNKLNNF